VSCVESGEKFAIIRWRGRDGGSWWIQGEGGEGDSKVRSQPSDLMDAVDISPVQSFILVGTDTLGNIVPYKVATYCRCYLYLSVSVG
jgi:hypothetical protein